MSGLTPYTIYVEGDDDVNILKRWFPHLPFSKAGGKDSVKSKITAQSKNWGILDRDFADDAQVKASRLPGNRLILLNRYCIENYLLEPVLIAAVARSLAHVAPALAKWTVETEIEQQIITWASELAIYAAANVLIARWQAVIHDGFLRYWGPLPPQPLAIIVADLESRLQRLPRSEEIAAMFDAQYAQVVQDITTWDGVHRWVNGKVLLEEYLFSHIFAQVRNFSKARLRDELIKAGQANIPGELTQLTQQWSV